MGDYHPLYDVNNGRVGNVKRPVDHQTCVVFNARALGKLDKTRTERESKQTGHEDCYRNPASGGNIYGVGKHEFAFRNVFKANLYGVPIQSTHGLSVELWTSFNNYKLPEDVLEWPQLFGIVDTEAMADAQTAPLRRDDVVVAVHGPRSTVHTGDTVIQAGDIVLALPPQYRMDDAKNCVPVRCSWKGKDDQKFLAETVPFFGYSSFDCDRIFRDLGQVGFNVDDNTLGDIFHHTLIRTIKKGTENALRAADTAANNANGQLDAASARAYMKQGALLANAYHRVISTIKDRFQAGRAMQTTQVAGQLDIDLKCC